MMAPREGPARALPESQRIKQHVSRATWRKRGDAGPDRRRSRLLRRGPSGSVTGPTSRPARGAARFRVARGMLSAVGDGATG